MKNLFIILALISFFSCNKAKKEKNSDTTNKTTEYVEKWIPIAEARRYDDSIQKLKNALDDSSISVENQISPSRERKTYRRFYTKEICLETQQTYKEVVVQGGYFITTDNYGNGVWIPERTETVPGEIICVKSKLDTIYY